MNAKKLSGILLLFLAINVMGQEANLTVKPVAKKKYNLQLNSQTEVVQSMGGMEMKVIANNKANAMMEIDEVEPNGNFTVLTIWKDIDVSTSIMGKDTVFRGENLNITMKTVHDKTGKTIKSDQMGESQSGNPSIAMIEQMAKNMKLPILPAKATKKGETWQSHVNDTVSTMEFPMAMILNMEDTYSFAGTVTDNGKEYYKIERSGPVKITGEGSQGGMDIKMEGTGMNEGTLLLNKSTLLPVKMEEKSGMDMSLIISGPQSMAIPVTQNTTTNTTFTEIK